MECAHSRAFSGAYEGSTAKERITLLVFTAVLAVSWPVLQLGSLEQSASLATVATLSFFLRDFVTFKSGVFKRYVLCPGIDMFNHNSSCASDVSYNYFSDSFELRTRSPAGTRPHPHSNQSQYKTQYQPDEQVFINYGAQSNDRFLQYYGFVEKDNPNDVYDFGVDILEVVLKYADNLHSSGESEPGTAFKGAVIPADPSPQMRIMAVAGMLKTFDADLVHKKSGPAISNTMRYHVRSVGARGRVPIPSPSYDQSALILAHFDVRTVAALRALYCTAEEWEGLFTPSDEKAYVRLCKHPSSLSTATEGSVADALRRILYLELCNKPTTLTEDVASLQALLLHSQGGELSQEQRQEQKRLCLYMQFRIEKKKLLHRALQLSL